MSINPETNISGGVMTGYECLIGTEATILQNKKLADSAIVVAGSVIANDVSSGLSPDRPAGLGSCFHSCSRGLMLAICQADELFSWQYVL